MFGNISLRDFKKSIKPQREILPAILLCSIFLFAYLTLLLVKHAHFGTGYDLSVINQVIWEYSRFLPPISTVHAYAFTSVLADHLEFIFLLIAPFYWILSDARTLIILQAVAISLSGMPVYLLACHYKINKYLSLAILFSYFTFYGIQNALWSDVHSLVFAAAFISFFIYFLEIGKKWQTILFFVLAIICKEDIALILFLISFVQFIRTRKRLPLYLMVASVLYIFVIFFVYFPHFTQGYRFANEGGLLSNLNILNLFNTREKIGVILYSLSTYGFVPVLNPLALIPFIGDLAHYFIFGSESLGRAQGIFMHYRVTDAILLTWPTILVIAKFKKLSNKYFTLYLLFFACMITYITHSPLTYLSKSWFWKEPSGVVNINKAIAHLPKDAYFVTQVNISPHVSNRPLVITMWGDTKNFKTNSPCGKENCAWFKWAGKPDYMLVDTSPEWDIRHLLANREDFISGLENMQKTGKLQLIWQSGSSKIYRVNY